MKSKVLFWGLAMLLMPLVVRAQNADVERKTIIVNGVSFTMVKVDGGTFTMGATQEQKYAERDEIPIHDVTLSTYYMGETEVTFALWHAVMTDNACEAGVENFPKGGLSWDDCQEFIAKLNQLTGYTFRLPTEAEWEYAARGGKKSQGYMYAGSNMLDEVAWYRDNSEGMSHAVAQKKPNELGLYDMCGNVYECCYDWYGSYSNRPQTNPNGHARGTHRVFRGGSRNCHHLMNRVTYRSNNTPSVRYRDLGLRLVM